VVTGCYSGRGSKTARGESEATLFILCRNGRSPGGFEVAREHNCPWEEDTCASAAEGGHLMPEGGHLMPRPAGGKCGSEQCCVWMHQRASHRNDVRPTAKSLSSFACRGGAAPRDLPAPRGGRRAAGGGGAACADISYVTYLPSDPAYSNIYATGADTGRASRFRELAFNLNIWLVNL